MPRGREQEERRQTKAPGHGENEVCGCDKKGRRELICDSVKAMDLTPCAHKLWCLRHIPRLSGVNNPFRKADGCWNRSFAIILSS